MHVITGMPRSGSTLLCNLLNQHPLIYASSTSPLCGMLVGLAQGMPTQPEVQSELVNGQDKRVLDCMRAASSGWYDAEFDSEIFDKGRGWSRQVGLLRRLWPESVVVCMVRDPRQVFASIDARNEETAELQVAPLGTMADRAAAFMKTDGMIGSCIVGVEDLLRRDPDNCLIVDYDEFVGKAQDTLARIVAMVGVEPHEFELGAIEGTATDVDALYFNKFPHDGSGELKHLPQRRLPKDIAEFVLKQYPYYCGRLGYNA